MSPNHGARGTTVQVLGANFQSIGIHSQLRFHLSWKTKKDGGTHSASQVMFQSFFLVFVSFFINNVGGCKIKKTQPLPFARQLGFYWFRISSWVCGVQRVCAQGVVIRAF